MKGEPISLPLLLADEESAQVLEEEITKCDVEVYNSTSIQNMKQDGDKIIINSKFAIITLRAFVTMNYSG